MDELDWDPSVADEILFCTSCSYQVENTTAECRNCGGRVGSEDEGRPDTPWYSLFRDEFDGLTRRDQFRQLLACGLRYKRFVGRYIYIPDESVAVIPDQQEDFTPTQRSIQQPQATSLNLLHQDQAGPAHDMIERISHFTTDVTMANTRTESAVESPDNFPRLESSREPLRSHPRSFSDNSWFTMTKSERQAIARNTTKVNEAIGTNNLRVSSSRSYTVGLDITDFLAKQSKKEDVWISLLRCDTLEAAFWVNKMCKRSKTRDWNHKIAVLSLTNGTEPSENFIDGSGAQEESLYVRTTLLHTLHNQPFYPEEGLAPTTIIYSPDVLVHGIDKPTQLDDDERFFIDVLSCATAKEPKIKNVMINGHKEEDYVSSSDAEIMEAQIQGILRIAVSKGVTHLVLDAIGCGDQFRHPHDKIARIFRQCLIVSKAVEAFRKQGLERIVFAIMEGESMAPTWEAFVRAFNQDQGCEVEIDWNGKILFQ